MDMDKPPYRLLYSVILFQVMTPIFDHNSACLTIFPRMLDLSCALPRNTGIFHNTTPNKLFLQRCAPVHRDQSRLDSWSNRYGIEPSSASM